MGLIGAEVAQDMLDQFRMVWLGGRVGGHKTSLALMLARPYLEKGYRLITNFPCAWSDDIKTVTLDEKGFLRAVVILDEGGRFIKLSSQIEAICSYPGKMQMILVISSFTRPAPLARAFYIKAGSAYFRYGLPLVRYEWGLEDDNQSGGFWWWCPAEIYGVYSRNNPGFGAQGIVNFLIEQEQAFERYHGIQADQSIPRMEEGKSEADRLADIVSSVDDTISGLKTFSRSGAAVSTRRGRR